MKYFIGYLAEGEVEKYYNAITAELAGKFDVGDLSKRVPPHLTLKYPFVSDDISSVEKTIEHFLIDKKPIPFVIDGFDKFDDNSETVFLSVTHDDVLYSFVKECITELPGTEERKNFDAGKFRLHMSVVRHIDVSMCDRILEYLAIQPKPHFDLSFDNLTLFNLEDNMWKVKRIFRIKPE
jgi:2'-5' RNA ligase